MAYQIFNLGDSRPLDFVSLGMLIIGKFLGRAPKAMTDFSDDIHHPDRSPMLNVLGGAGTYATMGARLFRPKDDGVNIPETVAFVIHAGSDFPAEVETEIRSWNTSSLIVRTSDRLTTRGLNVYCNGLRGTQ